LLRYARNDGLNTLTALLKHPSAAQCLLRIPGASLTLLDAAHISNVEQPHAFTDAVIGFLIQR